MSTATAPRVTALYEGGITDEQREKVARLRAAMRSRQKPQRCKKHPEAASRLFAVQEPGRRVRHVWLCVECASVLVGIHNATLRQP